MVGGIHATQLPEWHLAEDAVSLVVLGEGEETIVELCNALERRDRSIFEISGVAFRAADGSVVKTGPARRAGYSFFLPVEEFNLSRVSTHTLVDAVSSFGKGWL